MFERGLYGSELSKKNRYWTTEIYGYGIIADCKINKIGDHEYLSRDWRSIYFYVFIIYISAVFHIRQ